MDPLSIGICNCAGCQKEMLGERTAKRFQMTGEKCPQGRPAIAGRILGRPYCGTCLEVATPSGCETRVPLDTGGSLENAVRSLEESR